MTKNNKGRDRRNGATPKTTECPHHNTPAQRQQSITGGLRHV
jgi:hypothetical protein